MGRYGLSRSQSLVLIIGWFCTVLIEKSGCAPVSLTGNRFMSENLGVSDLGRVREVSGDNKRSQVGNVRSSAGIIKRAAQTVQRKDDAAEGTDNTFAGLPLATEPPRDISGKYILVVEVGGNRVLNSSQKEVLFSALAATLSVPKENIILENSHGNVYNMYVISEAQGGLIEENLIPAANVGSQLDVDKLNSLLPGFSVVNVLPQEHRTIEYDDVPFWETSYFPYVVGAVAAVLVLLLALICYCCVKRRKRKKEEKEATHVLYPTIKPEFKSGRMIQPESGQMYAPVARSQPIKIIKGLQERRGSNASLTIDLNGKGSGAHATHYGTPPKESSSEEYLSSAGSRMTRKQLRNSLKNVRALHEEFWDIPMNHPENIDVPGSGTKNRYRTILPNPHTRVVLPEINDDPLSTYINANYIRGYDQEDNAFIATQGAMPHTINDFWRMIWFTNAPIIVMITKLKERNKVKCEHYWPAYKREFYGEIEVCVDSTIRRDGYILRNMTLKYLDDTKHVKHFWYTAWPDHKTPDTAKQLLELVEEVERYRMDEIGEPIGPVTVHCSAGLGRTGCFIAISIGVRQLQEESMVDILGIVCQMRLDRGGMIQTNEQYEFIHQALCLYEKCLPDAVID